ncbi:hypothetical protein GQ457_16G007650 [Hibiscus cannabinus]
MDMVKQIATLQAEILNRLRHWGRYSTFDSPYDPRTTTGKSDQESMEWMMCDAMKAEQAISRARESNRDFGTTFMEVQWEVAIELGRILVETIDPVITGTDGVKIEKEEGGSCGVGYIWKIWRNERKWGPWECPDISSMIIASSSGSRESIIALCVDVSRNILFEFCLYFPKRLLEFFFFLVFDCLIV